MGLRAGSRSFHAALMKRGFVRGPGGAYRDSPEVRVICSAGVARTNMLADVCLGLWIFRVSDAAPEVFNHCHVYGSLGTICPKFKNLRIISGVKDEEAWRELIGCAEEIAKKVGTLMTVENLVRAFAEGRFSRCLIRKEARALLAKEAVR